MEFTIEQIASILGMLLGGGGIGAILTWQYSRRKEKAEAESAELNATKELQDVYQQLIDDVKADRNEQKAYIAELKDDRQHLRQERDDLRQRQDKLEDSIRSLQRDVARNGRMVEAMRPFLCARTSCPDRIVAVVSESGEVEEAKRPRKKKEENA